MGTEHQNIVKVVQTLMLDSVLAMYCTLIKPKLNL